MAPPTKAKSKSRTNLKAKSKSRSRANLKKLEGDSGEALTPAQKKRERKAKAAASAAGTRSPTKKASPPTETSPVASPPGSDESKLKDPKAKSLKYIGLEPEWNSEQLRKEQIMSDGFTYCIVLVMEESSVLSPYTQYLDEAVGTGIRRNFASISGRLISQKVRKFMTSAGLREAGQEDTSYMDRVDICAEAIKHVLLQYKGSVLVEFELQAKAIEQEITGVRSKEFIKVTKPVVAVQSFASSPGLEADGAAELSSPKPRAHDGTRKTSLTKGAGGKKAKGDKKGVSAPATAGDGKGELKTADADSPSDSKGSSSKPTLLRKRGEFAVPVTEYVDDSPPNGPHSYFFLQGFYNPDLLEQLQAVGVQIDCVLLITAGTINKRNFTTLDIEQNIAGTFRPHNILPEYVKAMEESHKDKDAQDQVSHFWVGLAEIINKAEAGSPIHDVALMNCSLPPGNPPETVEQQGDFASNLFDEAAQRVYEMLVLKDWYNEYKFATFAKELKPIEPGLSTALYDLLLDELPAECVTVPIIVECLLEQIVENERIEDTAMSKDSSSSPVSVGVGVDWDAPGCRIPGTNAVHARSHEDITALAETKGKKTHRLPAPNYIMNHDLASIRACHLNHVFASNVASTEVCGDFLAIQDLLGGRDMPEYSKGLAMKLLGNLNQFMQFLPPGAIKHEDMFYVLHLLMAAGVEQELQKQATAAAEQGNEGEDENEEPSQKLALKPTRSKLSEMKLPKSSADHRRSQYAHYDRYKTDAGAGASTAHLQQKEQEGQGQVYPGTKLRTNHNYLVVEKPPTSVTQFILAPRSNEQLEVKPLSLNLKTAAVEMLGEGDEDERCAQAAAAIATERVIETGAELKTPPNTATESEAEGEDGGMESKPQGEPEAEAEDFRDPTGKRFIACEEEWFTRIADDASVLQRLLECPALITINENGALDLDTWVKTSGHGRGRGYLNTRNNARFGRGGGDALRGIGPLEAWKYAEQLEPVQMIQALHAAVDSYLCVDRMYCPFYDSVIFIFTNPAPDELKSDTEFFWKLKTLPGLQHFLEYSINEDNVLDWLLELEKNKSVDVVDSISVTTLMRIVPENQWMLIPSIKYAILRAQKEQQRLRRLARGATGAKELLSDDEVKNANAKAVAIAGNASEEEEEDESVGQLKRLKNMRSPDNAEGEGESRGGGIGVGWSPTEKVLPPGVPGLEQASDVSAMNACGDPPFNFTDAIKQAMGQRVPVAAEQQRRGEKQTSFVPHKFNCYDLGKRVLTTASDIYHLYPMDGTRISYEVSAIEPSYHMLQLAVRKAGHAMFFYPYYIPHDMDLARESYVVCPYFHFVHANGTRYAFQDRRVTGHLDADDPYRHFSLRQTESQARAFSYEKNVLFTDNLLDFLKTPSPGTGGTGTREDEDEDSDKPPSGDSSSPIAMALAPAMPLDEMGGEDGAGEAAAAEAVEVNEPRRGRKGRGAASSRDVPKSGKEKKGKAKKARSVSVTAAKDKEGKKRTKGKRTKVVFQKSEHKDDEGNGNLEGREEEGHEAEEEEGEGHVRTPENAGAAAPSPTAASANADGETPTEAEGDGENEEGEWKYSSAENTEAEDEVGEGRSRAKAATPPPPTPPRLNVDLGWDDAVQLLQPMVHSFHVTLPSGQHLAVEDVTEADRTRGASLTRHIRQTYLAKGSASSVIERSRYCTMHGTVVKFMHNPRMQVLTARGVTTTIHEIQALAVAPETQAADASTSLQDASLARVTRGEVILPTGDRWWIKRGERLSCDPLFVFSSGVLPNGETFRRRQDGVVHLHRHDGTVITHYPDGTRFTTRMVLAQDPVEEFEDWEFVGLKYMIEHPNYATVITNTLSGNIHIKISEGEWVRVFADGSTKIGTRDEFKLDVDKYRATITNPPCAPGDKNIPNLVAVKLWHAHENLVHGHAETQEESSAAAQQGQLGQDEKTEATVAWDVIYSAKGENPKPTLTEQKANEGKGSPTKSIQSTSTCARKSQRPKPRKPGADTDKDKSVTPSAKSLRKPVKGMPKSKTEPQSEPSLKSIAIDETHGESEYEGEGEIGNARGKHEHGHTHAMEHERKKFEIDDFLQFTDMWTVCKAIDCFDNRFTVDIFGDTVVDKCDRLSERYANAAKEEIVATISRQFDLPKQYVSGILKSTSSEQLATLMKRKVALASAAEQLESCASTPGTRVFVVKRNLSGFEYLTKVHVEKLVREAQKTMGAVVMKDMAHGHGRRELIRIMEPVHGGSGTRGLWKSEYREPVFRPRFLATKQLRIARPEDLRWFSYIVTTAHARRPKFFLSPRKAYEKHKTETPRPRPHPPPAQRKSLTPPEVVAAAEPDPETQDKNPNPQESKAEHERERTIKITEAAQETPKQQKQQDVQLSDTSVKDSSETGEVQDHDSQQQQQKHQNRGNGRGHRARKASDTDAAATTIEKDKEKEKPGPVHAQQRFKRRASIKKTGRKGRSKSIAPSTLDVGEIAQSGEGGEEAEAEVEADGEDAGETDGVPAAQVGPTPALAPEEPPANRISLQAEEIPDYPSEPPKDLLGLYGVDETTQADVRAQFHADPEPTHSAIVLRNIVEIPAVDEKMTRALLAASLSYTKTVESQRRLYESHAIQDQRTEDEKQEQKLIKQRLLEQNLDQMHLLEQTQGNLLQFHM